MSCYRGALGVSGAGLLALLLRLLGLEATGSAGGGGGWSSSRRPGRAHSLRYFFTGVSPEAAAGVSLPEFLIVGYLDDQRFVQYDSRRRRDVPQSGWIEAAEQEDPAYWDWQSHLSRHWELFFRLNLWSRHNHSHGFHTWQWMHGCELSGEGHRRGYSQFAYDGKDYLSLDQETLTWTATDSRAQVTKRRWDADRVWTEGRRNFVEERCVEWLQKYLDYGKETLLRTEPPVVRVGRQVGYDGLELLVCQAYGFYPKEINAVWKKDGEVWGQDTSHSRVVPNVDGTYHIWISVTVDPKDRARYRCHVEHDGLQKPVEAAWEEAASAWPIMGGILGVAAVVLLGVGIVVCAKKTGAEDYAAAPTHDRERQSCTVGPDCQLESLEGVG